MVQQQYHLLKEQLSTLSSLSTYVLSILEKPGCRALFEPKETDIRCCQHEKLMEDLMVEDCTDLGTLMIKGLFRIQRKLKKQGSITTQSHISSEAPYKGIISIEAQSRQTEQEEDVSSEKEVSTTSIFDSLAQVTECNTTYGSDKLDAIEIKSEGEDVYDDHTLSYRFSTVASLLSNGGGSAKTDLHPNFAVQISTPELNADKSNNEDLPLDSHSNAKDCEDSETRKEGKDGKRYECSFCGKVLACYKNFIRHRKVHRESGKYTCKYCWKVFTTEASLKKHNCAYAPDDNAKTLKCCSCGKTFSSKSDLEGHMLIHGGRKPYDCSICSENFVSLFEYEVHMECHGSDKEYRCETCDKIFSSHKSLQRHRYLHSSQKPYPCQHCEKEFVTSFDLKKHALVHASQTAFMCGVCNKSYSNEESLKRHTLLHKQSSSKVHTCEKCHNSFALSSDLEEHMKMVHPLVTSDNTTDGTTNVQGNEGKSKNLLVCTICGKHYCSRKNLIRHKLLHNRGNEHPCPLCSKKFINSIDLRRHIFTHKTMSEGNQNSAENSTLEKSEKAKVTCELCQKVFKHRKYLRQHLVLHREKPFCHDCRKFFLTPALYDAHKESHTCKVFLPSPSLREKVLAQGGDANNQTCTLCQKVFGSLKSLRKHLLLHEEKQFCNLCKRFFVSVQLYEKHMQCHTSGEHLSCDICHKVFSSRSNLQLHRRLHLRHKLHICSICNKGFATPSTFRKHARTHTVERPIHRQRGSLSQGVAPSNLSEDLMEGGANEENRFENNDCSVCRRTFMSSFHLRMHMLTHKDVSDSQDFISVGDELITVEPNSSPAHQNNLSQSEQAASNTELPDTFRCGECLKLFDSVQQLQSHIMYSTCSSFNCPLCGEYLRTQKELDHHHCSGSYTTTAQPEAEEGEIYIEGDAHNAEGYSEAYTHHSTNEFAMNASSIEDDVAYSQDGSLCFTVDSSVSDLNCDIDDNVDIDDVIYRCKSCKTTFETKHELLAHRPQCSLKGCFECVTCGKLFDSVNRLNQHKYQHMDDAQKPWRCDVCLKGFATKSHLKRHALIHSAEKKFMCTQCGKGFIRRDMLKSHERKHH